MNFDKYKSRVKRNGENVGDAYANNTIAFIEATFHASPTFRVIGVSSTEMPLVVEMDARVVGVERMGSLREILFRPSDESLNIGAKVIFDGETWLIFDKFGANRALAEQCNRILKWREKDGTVIELDCIASAMDLGSKAKQSRNEIEWNKYDVRLPLGQLFVFAELTDETKRINLSDRFVFGSKVYEVVGIDDTTGVGRNGFGVIQLVVKVTTIKEEDDFVNGIAFNTHDNNDSATPVQDVPTKGGRIW